MELTEWQEALVEKLEKLHGPAKLARENSGLHVYIACPNCLNDASHGARELFSRHLAVNLDRFTRSGKYSKLTRAQADYSASCMRENQRGFSVSALLKFPSLEERGFVRPAQKPRAGSLEPPPSFDSIPEPGPLLIPVNELSENHVCSKYLRRRGLNPDKLWQQMGAEYCEQDVTLTFWRRFPGGLCDRYAGRLILRSFVNGKMTGWQARLIDDISEDGRERRMQIGPRLITVQRKNKNGEWETLPDFIENGMDAAREIARYLTSPGKGVRSALLPGYDAAVAWSKQTGLRGCVLVEGPISAAKPGPPFIAVCGKTITKGQADLICAAFDKVLWIAENDEKNGVRRGLEAAENAAKTFARRVKFDVMDCPGGYKDTGDAPVYLSLTEILPKLASL